MKKLLPVILLTSPTFAFDLVENNKTEVSDVMYIPEEGKTFIDIQVSRSSADKTSKVVATGLNYANSDAEDTRAQLTAGYGFAGNLSFFIEADYSFENSSDVTYGAGTTIDGTNEKSKSSGVSDPTFGLRYRLAEQQEKGFILDLELSLSPKTGDSESASTTKDGNNFRGGNQGNINLSLGKKYEKFSFSIEGGVTLDGSKDVKSLTSNNIVDVDSSTDFQLSGITQFQPNENIFFNLALMITSYGDYSQISGSTTTEIERDTAVSYALAAGYKLNESLALRFIYQAISIDTKYTQGTTVIDEESDINLMSTNLIMQF